MVRKYKNLNPLYPRSKLSRVAFARIVYSYCVGTTAKRCGEEVGCSRQTVQNIYSALGDRVEFVMAGNYSSAETCSAAEIMSLELRQALKLMPKWHKGAEKYFAKEITFEEYKHYRDTGEVMSKMKSDEEQSHYYNMFRALHYFSDKTFGVNRKTYSKYFSFCKFQYMLGIVIIELSEAGYIDVQDKNINGERSMFCFQVLLLSFTEKPMGTI